MSQTKCMPGEWVEIGWTALSAENRAQGIPSETRGVPLLARVKGFALAETNLGETVRVRTVTGRVLTGSLLVVRPNYTHSFGMPQPELLDIGIKLREEV